MDEVEWICDIGANHNQDRIRIAKLIKVAKEIGCKAVKFQLYQANKLYHSKYSPSKVNQLRNCELDIELIPYISDICIKNEIEFHCTPFSLGAIRLLITYVDAFKIGSYEVLWLALIKCAVQTHKPFSISFGNAKSADRENAMNIIKNNHPFLNKVCLYHCNPEYPAKPEHCNLNLVKWLKRNYGLQTGWSDHTRNAGVIHQAIAQGASRIEFHLDLDGDGYEYGTGHCWLPDEIGKVIDDVNTGMSALAMTEPFTKETLKWRTDVDGMRPLRSHRNELSK